MKQERENMLLVLELRFSVVQTVVRQKVPVQNMEDYVGPQIYLQTMQETQKCSMQYQVDAQKEVGTPWELHTREVSPQVLQKHGENRESIWSSFASRTCNPVRDPHCSNCS